MKVLVTLILIFCLGIVFGVLWYSLWRIAMKAMIDELRDYINNLKTLENENKV
mgnify:CR=1 FL=1